jgi:hypothetical protein
MNAVYPARSNQIAARMLGSEMMIMSPRDATLFSLNEVGAVVWQASDGRTSLSEIVQRVCDEFDVAPDAAQKDVNDFLTQMADHKLVSVSERATGGTA